MRPASGVRQCPDLRIIRDKSGDSHPPLAVSRRLRLGGKRQRKTIQPRISGLENGSWKQQHYLSLEKR